MSKQLVFTRKTPAIKININGLDVDRTKTLNIPTYPVTEVECEDGTKYIFEEPFYCVEKGA